MLQAVRGAPSPPPPARTAAPVPRGKPNRAVDRNPLPARRRLRRRTHRWHPPPPRRCPGGPLIGTVRTDPYRSRLLWGRREPRASPRARPAGHAAGRRGPARAAAHTRRDGSAGAGRPDVRGPRALTRHSAVLGTALAVLATGSLLTWSLTRDADPRGGGSAASSLTVRIGVGAPLSDGLSSMGVGIRASVSGTPPRSGDSATRPARLHRGAGERGVL